MPLSSAFSTQSAFASFSQMPELRVAGRWCGVLLALATLVSTPVDSTPAAWAQAPAVRSLKSDLQSVNPGDQMAALETLSQLGPSAAGYLPQIAPLLKSSDLAIRHEALLALAAIGPQAKSALPELLPLLEGSELLLKYEALVALRALQPDAKTVAPLLKTMLADPDATIRSQAAADILALDAGDRAAAVRALIGVLNDGKDGDRSTAVPWLAQAGADGLPALTEALEAGSPTVQYYVLEALGMMGPAAAPALPTVLKFASSPHLPVLAATARALGKIGVSEPAVVQALQTLSTHAGATVIRTQALQSLVAVTGPKPATLDQLAAGLKDADLMVRLVSCDLIASLGRNAEPLLPALTGALTNAEGALTVRIFEALAAIGAPALPTLERLLQNPDYTPLALQTLEAMGTTARPATAQVVKLLDQPETAPPRLVALTLAAINADPKLAGPALLKALQNPENPARPAAAYALGSIGERSAIKPLTNLVEDPQPIMRLAAAWALLQLDFENNSYLEIALPRFQEALNHPDPMIRQEVVRTLNRLGRRAEAAIPDLVRTLATDESPDVRMAAAMAFAELGDAAKPAISSLINLVQNSDGLGRRGVMFALGRLGATAAEAAPTLAQVVTTGHPQDAIVAAWALVRVAPTTENLDLAQPVLLNALGQERAEVSVAIARTLGPYAAKRPKILAAIQQLAQSSDPALRAGAAAALAK